MKNLTRTILLICFASLIYTGCTKTTERNSNLSEFNFNNSPAPNDTTQTAINQNSEPAEKEEFELIGKWKHVRSRLTSDSKPAFIEDDIYFTFEEKGKGIYTRTKKGIPEKPEDSTEFKWKWKDEKTLVMDKVRDEVIEAEIIDKGPRHVEMKVKDRLGIQILLQKPIK